MTRASTNKRRNVTSEVNCNATIAIKPASSFGCSSIVAATLTIDRSSSHLHIPRISSSMFLLRHGCLFKHIRRRTMIQSELTKLTLSSCYFSRGAHTINLDWLSLSIKTLFVFSRGWKLKFCTFGVLLGGLVDAMLSHDKKSDITSLFEFAAFLLILRKNLNFKRLAKYTEFLHKCSLRKPRLITFAKWLGSNFFFSTALIHTLLSLLTFSDILFHVLSCGRKWFADD